MRRSPSTGTGEDETRCPGAEDQPYAESVSLKFDKVDLEYRPQRPDGALDEGLHFKFDLKASKFG